MVKELNRISKKLKYILQTYMVLKCGENMGNPKYEIKTDGVKTIQVDGSIDLRYKSKGCGHENKS